MGEKTLDIENAAFWLPSSFLTDDYDYLPKDNSFVFDSAHSSLDSPISSELGDSTHNDDDFISELTRQLAHSSLYHSQKPANLSTSPQSTLTGFGPWTTRSGNSSNGSPNGPSTPPLTTPPQNDAAWELLYEAAGQVARLKINALAAEINHRKNQLNHHYNHQQSRGLLGAPRCVSLSSKPLHHHHHHHDGTLYDIPQYEQLKREVKGNFYCHPHNKQRSCSGPLLGLHNSAWPPLRPNNHHYRSPNASVVGMDSVFNTGLGLGPGPVQGMKRKSTGTGVFLPRSVGNNGITTTNKLQQAPQLNKQTIGCPSIWLQARVDALNMKFEEMNNDVTVNGNNRLLIDQEIEMARRNAVLKMEQQRRSFMRNDEIRLPSDWTY